MQFTQFKSTCLKKLESVRVTGRKLSKAVPSSSIFQLSRLSGVPLRWRSIEPLRKLSYGETAPFCRRSKVENADVQKYLVDISYLNNQRLSEISFDQTKTPHTRLNQPMKSRRQTYQGCPSESALFQAPDC